MPENQNVTEPVIPILNKEKLQETRESYQATRVRRKRRKMKRQIRKFFYDSRVFVPMGVIIISVLSALVLFILIKSMSGI